MLLIVDTIRASLAGSEDSSEHVAAYMRVVRRLLARVPGAAALLAHHAGWQDGDTQRKRERGSSAWRGNSDGTLYLEAGTPDPERHETPLTLTTRKLRDGELPPPLHLIRRQVELLERDRRGDPKTSCVIESDRRTREDRLAEHAQAEAASHADADKTVLKAIVEHPESASSQDRLRQLLGIRKVVVSASLSRLLQCGWIVHGRRGQPYQVTDAGRLALGVSS